MYSVQELDYGYVHQALCGFIGFDSLSISVSPGVDEVVITVRRRAGARNSTSVSYSTANGTAIAGVNYTATSGTLTWDDGELGPKTFSVPVQFVDGSDLSFTINLTKLSGCAVLNPLRDVLTVVIAGIDGLLINENDAFLLITEDGGIIKIGGK